MIGSRPGRRGRHAWLAVLRIARRDALRARGRSALVVALVALPMAAIAGADVFVRTVQPDTDVVLTRTLGTADARYEVRGGLVDQAPDGRSAGWDAEKTVARSPPIREASFHRAAAQFR